MKILEKLRHLLKSKQTQILKISRREGKTGRKKDASAVALITSEGYVLQVADSDEEHKC